MNDEYLNLKCPICGKQFHASYTHQYAIKTYCGKSTSIQKLCSYTCQRKWEREMENRPRERRRRERIERELAGEYGIAQAK